MGCQRNFTADACGNKAEHAKYNMYTLESTIWEDNPFSILSTLTKEDCENKCYGDCNCEAALFKDRECRKQMLPVIYGRRDAEGSTTAFIKLGSRSPVSRNDTQVDKESKKELRKDILIICVSLAACAFIILAITSVLIYRHRVWTYQKLSNQGDVGLTKDITLQPFTYSELEKVTKGFKEELGRGSFGTVFKGTLSNGQKIVAVKRLENVMKEGEREFQNEVMAIGRTHHRNLVQLVGYCHDGPDRLLVYEYMSNIECENQIIHCDTKPQNILIDENRCAKISDFGLAKLLKPDQTKTFTAIRGTRGYVAPEWHRNIPITMKADVYSFGVMLLEIIFCRRGVDMNSPEEEVMLTDWVYDCFEAGKLGMLVADDDVNMSKLERMVRVGLWCIQDEPSLRPIMKKVVLMLEGTVDIPVPPSPTSFLSAI